MSSERNVSTDVSDADRLGRAARGLLDDDEQALLRWPVPPRAGRTAPWTAADAVLADELAGLLERTPGYGHMVLDEAQDLSTEEILSDSSLILLVCAHECWSRARRGQQDWARFEAMSIKQLGALLRHLGFPFKEN